MASTRAAGGQPALPGLGASFAAANRRPKPLAPEPNITPDDAPGYPPYDWPFSDQRRADTNGLPHNTRPNYRGPMPGQTVMGVSRLSDQHVGYMGDESHYEVDPHGFVGEHGARQDHDLRGGSLPQGMRTAQELYGSHGGLYGKTLQEHLQTEGYSSPSRAIDDGLIGPNEIRDHNRRVKEVTAHWNKQPLVQMSTESLIHTGQRYHVTEGEDDNYDGHEGRDRINEIRTDVEHGERIRKPAWIAKVNGRNFALDGHHRIVAAREGGAETFPARVWDIDAENAARTRSVDKLPEHVRQKMRRMVDKGHITPEEIHPKWRSDVMR